MYLDEPRSDPGQPRGLRIESSSPRAPAGPRATLLRSPARIQPVELAVDYGNFLIGNDPVRLRTYNKKLVGPVLRVKAGETLSIVLRNQLPLEPVGHDENSFHHWNTTNLHFHGLHVAPQGPSSDAESDNVLLELEPNGLRDGSVQNYEVHIPENHIAGTFWYHAHKHGSSAAQVSSGMVGALIIERNDSTHNLDSVPRVRDAGEEILVLQQIPYLRTGPFGLGEIERSPDGSGNNEANMFGPRAWKDLKRYVLVNGVKIPTITIAPGEVRRLRLIDAGQRDAIRLKIERDPSPTVPGPDRLPFYEIAVDGLPTGNIVEKESLELFPGYRSDVLVHPPENASGVYYLIDANAAEGTAGDGSPEPLKWVAKIVVEGTPRAMERPRASELRPHRLDDPPTPTGTQYAYYGLVFPPEGGARFYISRRNLPPGTPPDDRDSEYEPTRPRILTLGKTETWVVGNRNGINPRSKLRIDQVHPFHIHVNPFLVEQVWDDEKKVDVTATEFGGPTWRDTLAMKVGYTYKLRTTYEDFTGSFVNHCHVLDHEDLGMMERVTITGPGGPVPAPLPRLEPGVTAVAATAPLPRLEPAVAAVAAHPDGPRVMLFVKGSLCPHCMGQITEMAKALGDSKADVVVISAGREDDLKGFPKVPFKLVADPAHDLFRRYGAFKDGEPMHATIVVDRSGKAVLNEVGEAPFLDVGAVRTALVRARTRVAIAVRNTDASDDDYLTWAPTPCRIRIVDGQPGGPDVVVTLTNDPPEGNPDGGDVRFATSLRIGQTATSETITVALKQDGTPVDFFAAGFKASRLTPASLAVGGRDAVIEVHDGGTSGPVLGTAAVMVRVRKDLQDLCDFELNEFLKAIRHMHRVDRRYERYVLMHRLANVHDPARKDPSDEDWPDQAHDGPGFIAWHRAFLLLFERDLQRNFPHVAIPYWVQGQGQTFFAAEKFGVKDAGADTNVVSFRRGTPLYGWAIDLPGDHGGPAAPMGVLRRNPIDHNDPGVAKVRYRQWPDFVETFKDLRRFVRIMGVEQNPHNNGHTTVGPPGTWMSNCRESNADPVFWVFHCNHDQLWARWQREYDRFESGGANPDHYAPRDSFRDASADRKIPLGHHLKDEMWPWDGTTGQVVPGEAKSNRPNSNDFGEFPAAPLRYQWPSAPARPRPADVIDYLGVTGKASELGFCYDRIPYGASPPPGPRSEVAAAGGDGLADDQLKAQIFLDGSVRPELRVAAARQIEGPDSGMKPESLIRVATAADSSSELRVEALRHLIADSPMDGVRTARRILEDERTPAPLGVRAVDELGTLMHFAARSPVDMDQVHEGLRRAMRGPGAGPVRAAAIRQLAPQGDAEAERLLITYLGDASASPLPAAEVISLLRFYPGRYEAIRPYVGSANDELAMAAIQALYRDEPSADARRRAAADRRRSPALRNVAIRSLMHDVSVEASAAALVGIFADLAEDLDVRAEAIAAAGVLFEKNTRDIPPPDRARWSGRITAVATGDPATSELGALKAQALEGLSDRR
jgi:FtsP/CotA-like multicopper oxidase with cupredoxin domain/peroxiredoxin